MLRWAERFTVRRPYLDLPSLRARVVAATAQARTTEDTYPVISAYLDALGDNHSALYRPASARSLLEGRSTGFGFQLIGDVLFPFPDSPAAIAGIRDRDRLVSVNGTPFSKQLLISSAPDTSTFVVNRAGEPTPVSITVTRGPVRTAFTPSVRALDERVGYVELPGSTGSAADEVNFARAGLEGIRSVDTSPRCGWVLDLRRNTGGFPYSMLAAIAPLYGDGSIGGTVNGDRVVEPVLVSGSAIIAGSTVRARGPFPYSLATPNAPLAILTSSATASAGEFTIVGFAGRGRTRIFGEATFGVTSANTGRSYPDGSFVAVTSSYHVDRTGKTYDGPIQPDEPRTIDWTLFGTANDPLVSEAQAWVRSQC